MANRYTKKFPTELELQHEDIPFKCRFSFEEGESSWFDAKAGVGSPGYDPSVELTEVNFGDGWKSPELFPQLNIPQIEDEILQKLGEIQEAKNAQEEEALYQQYQEFLEEPQQ